MTDAPNPFTRALPTQLRAWDATSLRCYMECPRKYQLMIVEGWRLPEGPHTRWGSLLHGALETYDKAIALSTSKEDALDEAFAWALEHSGTRDEAGVWHPMESRDNKKTRHTLLRAVVWYIDEQREEDGVRAYVFPNGKPAVELSFQIPLPLEGPDGEPYLLCGHMDGLVEFGDEVAVRERKTTGKTLAAYYFNQFSPDVQIDTYDLASSVLFPDLAVRATMLEATQTAVNFARFHRHFIHSTEGRREEHLRDVMYHIKEAERNARNSYYPKRESSCYAHGGCPMRDICSKDPSVRERYLKGLYEVRKWNPLEER